MPTRLRTLFHLITVIATVSLATNLFLAWQWQSEKTNLQTLIASQTNKLQQTNTTNKKLKKDIVTKDVALAEKDQELSAKTDELAKKQAELNTLSQDLESKKKEVEAKAAELSTKQKDLAAAQKRIDDQKSQLETNSGELAKLRNRPPLFSFQIQSSKLADAEQKKAAVKQIVTAAYDTIEEVFGKPYLLSGVTISFVEELSNPKASGEIVISNSDKGLSLTIKLLDFDQNDFDDVNTIIHEIVHAFDGVGSPIVAAQAEGKTVAITDAVMKRMIASGKLPQFNPLYIRISEAEFAQKQASLSIPRDSSAFYSSDLVTDYYQVLGKAWYKLYEQDSNFFKKVNEKLFAKKNDGQEITEEVVLSAVREASGAVLSGAAWNLK